MHITKSRHIILIMFAMILLSSSSFASNMQYTYDNLNRLTRTDYGNGKYIEYTYDAAGNITSNSKVMPAASSTTTTIVTTSSTSSSSTTTTIACTNVYYSDADGDSYGNAAVTILACLAPAGYVSNSADCNDTNAAVHPGAPDAYLNGIDNNCNGLTDEEYMPITEECKAWLGAWAFTYSDTGYQKVVITSVCGDNDPCMTEAWTCGASGTRLSDGQAVSLRGSSMFPGDTFYYEVAVPDQNSTMDGMIGHNVSPYVSFTLNPSQIQYGDGGVLNFTLLSGVKRTAKDFNKDGKADVVAYDGAGNVEFRKMNGAATDSISTVAGIAGAIVGTGNFNGDDSTDILALNGSTYTMYLMDSTAIQSSADITVNGTVQGIGDLNGDGKDDIITRNASGRVYAYLMNGTTVASSAKIYTEANPAWEIVAVADFDGNGKADILYRNATTGQLWMLLMNGTAISSRGSAYYEANTAWKVVAAADFNGDGKADILYRNDTTGQLWMLLMDGTAISSRGSVYHEANLAWQIAAVADFNGDGKADILYRNTTTDQVWMLMMNGKTISSRGSVYYENAAYTILK